MLQENHYYAFGMAWNGDFTQPNASENKYLYNGTGHTDDFGLDWNFTPYRTYDPAIAGWGQIDPLAETFYNHTPYSFSFNNPILFSDPTGLAGETNVAGMVQAAWDATPDGTNATYTYSYSYSWNPHAGDEISREETENGVNIQYSGGYVATASEWQNLNKSTLKSHARSTGVCNPCTANELGSYFEDIFFNYMMTNHRAAAVFHGFRRVPLGERWTDAGTRNTVPDFSSNGTYFYWRLLPTTFTYVPVNDYGIYEAKNKSGGLYLSSNNRQVQGHIDNLAARHRGHIARGAIPNFTLITTSDVKWSASIAKYARRNKIRYTHLTAQYRIIDDGSWEFRFVAPTRSFLSN